VAPKVRILDRDGLDRGDTLCTRFTNGDAEFLCLLREPNIRTHGVDPAATVRLREERHVYDIRKQA